MTQPFNPLAMDSLAHSIVTELESMKAVPLDNVPRFYGTGIYALYYSGEYPAYQALTDAQGAELSEPIYVGKAMPSGGRKGLDVTDSLASHALADRIREHATSIRSAENIGISDFWARWLVVETIFIPLGESALIREYRPVWNAVVDGFGNHDPGRGRIAGLRPRWDTLHPGRPWAGRYPERNESPADIEQDVIEYLRSRLH
ncbi:MAG: Eco29kI family restriction endonuclease [Cellulomonadaceae bacterium]|jgi:hypothetical protein|nr:Eco29kI family restriction endonuclease [Cellulomonadaceae bacterium]